MAEERQKVRSLRNQCMRCSSHPDACQHRNTHALHMATVGRTICQEGVRHVVIILSLISRVTASPSAMAAPGPTACAPLPQGDQPQLPAVLRGRVFHLQRAHTAEEWALIPRQVAARGEQCTPRACSAGGKLAGEHVAAAGAAGAVPASPAAPAGAAAAALPGKQPRERGMGHPGAAARGRARRPGANGGAGVVSG